jgi:hypothetical protein
MSIRRHVIAAALAVAFVAPLAAAASAEEREQNVFADIIAAQRPNVTILDLFGGGAAPRQEARNTVAAPVQSDLSQGSGTAVSGAADHMYDYLSGPTYQGGS